MLPVENTNLIDEFLVQGTPILSGLATNTLILSENRLTLFTHLEPKKRTHVHDLWTHTSG